MTDDSLLHTDASGRGLWCTAFGLAGRQVAVLSLPLAPRRWPACLTVAEREIAGLLIDGHPVAEIAAQRGTSPSTVTNQLHSMYTKLGVSGRSEFVAALFRRGGAGTG